MTMRGWLLVLFVALTAPAVAEPIDPSDVYVVDGDTIEVFHVQPNVRLVGFDAPETWRPECEAERVVGLKAKARLQALVHAGHLDFHYVRCSCTESQIDTGWCNWGRDCGTLMSNGRDVGDILIAEGLAVPFICSATRCPKKPHAWCH
jgi:endonuclease YncB( thermonuclease family)